MTYCKLNIAFKLLWQLLQIKLNSCFCFYLLKFELYYRMCNSLFCNFRWINVALTRNVQQELFGKTLSYFLTIGIFICIYFLPVTWHNMRRMCSVFLQKSFVPLATWWHCSVCNCFFSPTTAPCTFIPAELTPRNMGFIYTPSFFCNYSYTEESYPS